MAADWKYLGCFGHVNTSQKAFALRGGFTWSECQYVARELGTAQFALGSKIDTTANCHVGSALATAERKSEQLCPETDGHVYGGAYELAVYQRDTTITTTAASDTDTVTIMR